MSSKWKRPDYFFNGGNHSHSFYTSSASLPPPSFTKPAYFIHTYFIYIAPALFISSLFAFSPLYLLRHTTAPSSVLSPYYCDPFASANWCTCSMNPACSANPYSLFYQSTSLKSLIFSIIAVYVLHWIAISFSFTQYVSLRCKIADLT